MVCIDLSSPYRRMVRTCFPRAKIVVDRFHVMRVIIHHFMELARQIAPEIKNHRGLLGQKPNRGSKRRSGPPVHQNGGAR